MWDRNCSYFLYLSPWNIMHKPCDWSQHQLIAAVVQLTAWSSRRKRSIGVLLVFKVEACELFAVTLEHGWKAGLCDSSRIRRWCLVCLQQVFWYSAAHMINMWCSNSGSLTKLTIRVHRGFPDMHSLFPGRLMNPSLLSPQLESKTLLCSYENETV